MEGKNATMLVYSLIPMQDQNHKILWFWFKWVYKFLPAKNLCTYQDIFCSNITEGVVNSKKYVRNPLNPNVQQKRGVVV